MVSYYEMSAFIGAHFYWGQDGAMTKKLKSQPTASAAQAAYYIIYYETAMKHPERVV